MGNYNSNWIVWAKRESSDYPLNLIYYYFTSMTKVIKLHNKILFVNFNSKMYGCRDRRELENWYKKIRAFSDEKFKKINQETKEVLEEFLVMEKKNYVDLFKNAHGREIIREYKKFNELIYKFLHYFVLIQYIGHSSMDIKTIKRNFDKSVLIKMRYKGVIDIILSKIDDFFSVIYKKMNISKKLLLWALPIEIEKFLQTKQINKNYSAELKARKKFYFYIYKDKKTKLITNKKVVQKNLNFLENQNHDSYKNQKLEGKSTFLGKVRGKVKIICSEKDFKKFSNKDILVCTAAMPYYQPIFGKAAGIVTDEGGQLSHAAVISREMKIPCIVGTKIATQVLKDDDLIEIDANKGVVKKINK